LDRSRRRVILGGGAFAVATASSAYGLPSRANFSISPVKRILVIEENALTALAVEIILTEAGYEVICPTGFSQLTTLIFNSRIDAALLDAHIYGEPTTELALTLTAASIPFAFTSGYGPYLSERLPRQFHGIAILAKPFGRSQLLRLIQGLV
jgi:DNA-binding response OmpR family regulator